MKLFFGVIIVSFLILVGLVLLLLSSMRYFQKRNWAKIKHYVMPVVLSLVILFFAAYVFMPCILDYMDLRRGGFETTTAKVSNIQSPFWVEFEGIGKYRYNSFESPIEIGKIYTIRTTRRTSYVYQFIGTPETD